MFNKLKTWILQQQINTMIEDQPVKKAAVKKAPVKKAAVKKAPKKK